MVVQVEITPAEPKRVKIVLDLTEEQAGEFARQLGKISYGSGPAMQIRNGISISGVDWEDFDGAARREAWRVGN
jgi:hypothetical protein